MKSWNPFQNENGEIQFPMTPTLDRVFLLPSPLPEKYGEGILEIPKSYRKKYTKSTAILLAAGPGYYDKEGRWRPVPEELKPGVTVCYDHQVPWRHVEVGLDGEEHLIILCGASDIFGVFDE